METKDVLTALAALAHETRLAIFRLLVETGPEGLPVGKIGERLGTAPATLSFHLKELAQRRSGDDAARGALYLLFGQFRHHERPVGLPDRKLLRHRDGLCACLRTRRLSATTEGGAV